MCCCFIPLRPFFKSTGTRTFRNHKEIAWAARWPLLPGTYQAVTLRDGIMPFDVIATTAKTFEISAPTTLGPDAIQVLRTEIENLMIGSGDMTLASKFLRLGFHDCVGGCDGCVSIRICIYCPDFQLIL